MADLLANAVQWLNTQRKTSLARTVRYSRGEQSVEVSAAAGSTAYDVVDESGVTVEAHSTDWIVAAADLVIGSEVVKPEPGDRITVNDGTMVGTYEVLPLGAAGHYRHCDPGGTMIRIHTKRIDTEVDDG